MGERAERVVQRMAERELDLLLVTDLVNVRWLTGFTGSNAATIVGARDRDDRRFITDFRYLTQAAEQVGEAWEREITQEMIPRLAERLPGQAGMRVGFDDATMSVRDHARLAELAPAGVELVPAGGLIEELREIKEPAEIDKIRGAARLADEALQDVLGRGLAGRTERDVAIDIEFTMRRMGAEAPSFEPIVAAGPHGALPHAKPCDVEIPPGTLVVIDWGAQVDGYASDCTRTFATGEIDARDREIYELVRLAQEEALAAVRPGPTGREVDTIAREIIASAGHGEHFGHGLGHGVGMAVHEGPRLSQTSDGVLGAGMVVTVEPGVYVPGAVGVRIEDLVVVTAQGADVLSTLPKELQTVV